MSAERIDHAATAEAMLNGIGSLSNVFQAERVIAMAQVHATLAVAEEQHNANLIAYVAKWTDDEVLDIDAMIREGLGL
ncbi:hypothetical protein [uncultured Microbacterium sp.]|uniref:hypothetical protein n=1 Tax=uncultured Microbacterium sp. TaxID=191216 RepID=UPI0025E3F36D|nr:hypothetical protein [uncultured Microbacterium sp.]